MEKALKLVAIGDSTGVILPEEILTKLKLVQGDTVNVVDTPTGIELRLNEASFDDQMQAAREVMHRRHSALHELAK